MKCRGLTDVCVSSQVYISCQVMMCKEGGSTRCSRGCMRSGRRKREAASETARHFISQGPLRLRGSAESPGLRGPAVSPGKNCRGLHQRCCVWGPPSDRVPLFCSPEPEPGVRCWVCPGGSGHDQRSGGVQNQDVRGPVPASAHAGQRRGPVKQSAPRIVVPQSANSPCQRWWFYSRGVMFEREKVRVATRGHRCGSCGQRWCPFWFPAL